MGSVEIALREDADFSRVVAIKRLHPHLLDEESFVAMFVDEARLAAMIRHANVVGVIDVGHDERGPFFVMDYVEGLSLSKVLQHHARRGELVPLQVCLRIAKQICDGLHAAHELRAADGSALGLVHRDISPQNALLGFDGTVRLLDFGIAKATGRLTKTALGTVKGKFGYMSPEQLQYESLDRRSDLFSLGVLLHEMISGSRLYDGESHEAARRILREPPPDLHEARDDIPDALVELSFELLAKDRAQRPATALEVSRRIDALLAEQVALEGSINLDEYVAHAFSAEIDAQRSELESALQNRSRIVRTRASTKPKPISEPPTRLETAAQPAQPRRIPRWAIGFATLVLCSGAFGWASLRTHATRAEAPSFTRAPRPPEPEPPTSPAPDPLEVAPTRTATARSTGRPQPKSHSASGMPMWKWKP